MVLPSFQGNYIDLIILAVVLLYVAEALERGFWEIIIDSISFLSSFVIALRAYSLAAALLVSNFAVPRSFANALGFVSVAALSNAFLSYLAVKAIIRLPQTLRKHWTSKVFAVFPAVANSSILIAGFLTLIVAIPISPKVKNDVVESKIGGFFIQKSTGFQDQLNEIFGGAINDTLTFLTIRPGSAERVEINYKPQVLAVDEKSESEMFALVNQERVKRGIKPLVWDLQITLVARRHSRDMWERGYFSHINPDGKDPFDRMREGSIHFNAAGENLALAPTLSLAHSGLMNSEGHRKNILESSYGRIGIGVIDGGIYGEMITQNFAD